MSTSVALEAFPARVLLTPRAPLSVRARPRAGLRWCAGCRAFRAPPALVPPPWPAQAATPPPADRRSAPRQQPRYPRASLPRFSAVPCGPCRDLGPEQAILGFLKTPSYTQPLPCLGLPAACAPPAPTCAVLPHCPTPPQVPSTTWECPLRLWQAAFLPFGAEVLYSPCDIFPTLCPAGCVACFCTSGRCGHRLECTTAPGPGACPKALQSSS